MITRPLDLQAKLAPPPRDLDVVFWVTLAGICLFFGLLGSRFVLAPGLPVGVNTSAQLELPQVGTTQPAAASVVVSYRRDNIILFEGGMYSPLELKRQLEAYVAKHPGAVMLVRADRQVTAQALFELWDLAKQIGFSNVIMAVEPQARPASGL